MIPFEYSHVKLEYFRTDHYYHSDIPQVRQMFSSVNTTWKMKTANLRETENIRLHIIQNNRIIMHYHPLLVIFLYKVTDFTYSRSSF